MALLRALSAVLLSSAAAPVAVELAAGPAVDVTEVSAVPQRPPLRSEWFVLEEAHAPSAAGAVEASASGAKRVTGVVRLVRRARPGATQLESEATFARDDRANGAVRVLAVEELTRECASLSWRQIAAGSGRSLRAEWHAGDGALDVTEWGNGPRWREELPSDEGALLPHYLLELLRNGRLATGRVPCFDPLTRSIELVDVATWYESRPGGPLRTVELRRLDRTLFARYRFEGARLAGFELQEGGASARAIDEAEYEAQRNAIDATAEAHAVETGPVLPPTRQLVPRAALR
jgi:hypothetical protein